MIRKQLFLIITILLSSWYANSQIANQLRVFGKYHYGYILPHHESMEYFIKKRVSAVDLMVGKKLDGSQHWQQLHNYPTVGAGLYIAELGNAEVLGKANSAYFFILYTPIQKKKYSFNYNVSLGLAYLTKHFNYQTNYYNFAIGTPINIYVNFNFEHKYQLTSQLEIIAGMGFTHYSNGAFRMPNYGLNVISATAGANYRISKDEPTLFSDQSQIFKPKYELQISQIVGLNGTYPTSAALYFLTGTTINFGRKFSPKGKYGAGLDIFYNEKNLKNFQDQPEDIKKTDLIHYGIHLSYDVVLGKIEFSIQPGYYVYKKFSDRKSIYERIGFKYKFSDHIFYQLSLMAYYANAQYVETGFGIYF